MAASVVKRRYISAVYEDKYFPEKNAAIPFKWETSPGRPKYEDADDYQGESKDASKQGSCIHNMCNESYTYLTKDNKQLHTPHVHAMSIYPLRPPPKVISPARPLRVKDLLLHRTAVCDHNLSDHRFDDDDHCPLHAYHRKFSRLSIRFRSLKASTVVPVYKNHCVLKRSPNGVVDESQASSLVAHSPFQGRSQSFNHAVMHGAGVAASCRAANGSDVVRDASMQVPERRCNSFNFHSAHHSVLDHDNKVPDDDDDDDTSSMAAAAVWAGACILAAAAAHDVVSADHHDHGPCRVAMKLRDLMQQSVNFSELQLPMMTKLKKGGGSAINIENLAQVALCHATITPAAKRKTESLEEEVKEAFLREGTRKSCTHDDDDDDDDVEHEPTKEKASHEGADDQPGKLVKRKSFLKVFKNECIACWCPTLTL